MENNVKHFTLGPSDENTYGWPWNEVVKRYLESGYAGDQKEFQVEIRGKEYKILKRDAVTVFYDEAGNTLFDVTNDRLEKEYNSLTSAVEEEQESDGPESSVGKAIEAIDRGTLDAAASEEDKNTEGDDFVPMGKASLADIMTGNIPDPTPEEVETAKKANAGDIQAKAKQKLEDEVKEAKNKSFAEPIIEYLIERCKESESLANDICQDHKTLEKCYNYIVENAKKKLKGKSGPVRSDVVFEWAEDYFHKDDKAEEEKKDKAEKERKKLLRNQLLRQRQNRKSISSHMLQNQRQNRRNLKRIIRIWKVKWICFL